MKLLAISWERADMLDGWMEDLGAGVLDSVQGWSRRGTI